MTKNKAYEIAVNGSEFLASMIKPSGKFVYGFDHETGKKVKGYNILRHAGCIWALLDVVNSTKNQKILKKCEDAICWMLMKRTKKFAKDSRMVIEGGYAKLGGAGLGALALIRYHQIRPHHGFLNAAIELCNYIAEDCITIKGKPKYQKRDLETGKDVGFFSNFYPGEAALALSEVNKFVNNIEFEHAALNIVKYMYQLRGREGHVRDHWMLQTIESLKATQFMRYAGKIAKETVGNPLSIKVGPTACRTETLLSYYNLVKSEKLRKRILKYIEMLLKRQAKCQVKNGKNKGAFLWSPKDVTIRNDVCQHNISSFIRYTRIK